MLASESKTSKVESESGKSGYGVSETGLEDTENVPKYNVCDSEVEDLEGCAQ